MKYTGFRFSRIPISAVILMFVTYPLSAINLITKGAYIFIFGVCAAMVVVGNLLVVFFPKDEHKDYFRFPHKLLVVGFACFALAGFFAAIGVAPGLKNALLYAGMAQAVLGVIGIART